MWRTKEEKEKAVISIFDFIDFNPSTQLMNDENTILVDKVNEKLQQRLIIHPRAHNVFNCDAFVCICFDVYFFAEQ